MDVRYLNRFIKESEEKRLAGVERMKSVLCPEDLEEFEAHSLKNFVRWYIQRSLNSQWRYAEGFVRKSIRESDERSGILSLEPAQETEVDPMPDLSYPIPEASQRGRKETLDGHRKAAKTLVRSSRYQSQFG